MEAGNLQERIYFERCIVTKNEYGHEDYTYEPAFSTRAQVIYNSGDRQIENQEIFYPNTLTFKCRFYVPVEDLMRIKYKDLYYRILSIDYVSNIRNQKTIIAELCNE